MDFYCRWRVSDEPLNDEIRGGFRYNDLLYNSFPDAMERAKNAALQCMVPVLDQINSPKDVLDYDKSACSVPQLPLEENSFYLYDDLPILFTMEDPWRIWKSAMSPH